MRRLDPFLILLWCVFAILATTTAILVPLFEGPDEDDHFRFAKYLADQRALPVQLFQAGGGEAGHQGWQPPLYYGLAALVISPVNTADFDRRLQRNSAAALTGDVACCGRNNYFHLGAENFPYTRTTLAVHLARLVTILFGLAAVYAIYALTLTIFPAQNYLALGTTALATLNPSFLYSSALVSNDIPLVAFCTLSLLVIAKILTHRWDANWKSFAVLGVIVALGILTKTTALGLLPLILVLLIYLAYRNRSLLKFFSLGISFALPVLILAGWYFARNQLVYGDPLAYKLIAASALPPRDAPLTFAELTQINLPWLWQTFWGGPTPGDFPQPLLTLFLVAFAFGILGTVLYLVRQRRALGTDRLVLIGILFLWLAFIFIAQLQFIRTASGTDQGRYLFPAIAGIALIYTLGWSELVLQLIHPMRRAFDTLQAQRAVALVTTGFFIALHAFILFSITGPVYAKPAAFPPEQLAQYGTEHLVKFQNGMELRGFSLSSRAVSCGDKLGVTLFWTTDRRLTNTYRTFAHLVSAQGTVAGNKDVIPGRGAFPTVYWQPDEWLQDTIYVPLNHGARTGTYNVIIGTYKFGDPDNRVNLQSSQDDFVTVGDVQLNAPPEGCP